MKIEGKKVVNFVNILISPCGEYFFVVKGYETFKNNEVENVVNI